MFPVHFQRGSSGDFHPIDVDATATVYPDSIKVVLHRGHLPLSSNASERIDALSLGLADGDIEEKWKVERQSPKVWRRDIRTRGDTLADSVVFYIPDTRGLNLASHWLVLEDHAVVRIKRIGGWADAVQFYFSDRTVFHEARSK